MAGEIDTIRALLKDKPRPTTYAERRERINAIGAAYPPPADIPRTPCDAGGVPGEWSLAPGSDAERVLLYFHGGGYCSGSIISHRGMVTEAGRAAGMRTLAVEYSLAPEHPFPAGLEDALAAYGFLRQQGYAPAQIAIGGDSAGGGLTLATLIRLREAGEAMPGAAWLISPWVDLEMTGGTITSKAPVDPLISEGYLRELAGAYIGGGNARNPLISPLHADLSGLPPVLVQVGSAEELLDEAVWITGRLGAADVKVTLEVWPHMIHAWPLWNTVLADGRAALASAGAFMRAHLAGA